MMCLRTRKVFGLAVLVTVVAAVGIDPALPTPRFSP
jgi:hypothetical protein